MLSIFAGLLVGFWLPLRMIGIQIDQSINIFFDLLVSLAAVANVYLYFAEKSLSPKSLKSWLSASLFLDLVCILPFSLAGDLGLSAIPDSKLLFLNLLAARHIIRIKTFLDGFSLQPVVYRLIPIGLMMPLLVHLVACAWIGLGSGTSGPDPDKMVEYIKAIYWAFTTLTTVGYGDISAKTPPQMLFTCGVQVCGVGVFGFVLSNVASLLSRADAAREHHMNGLDRIETFMTSHNIPNETRSRVRDYFHFLWTRHKGYHDRTLLEDLPGKIQSELFSYINKPVVSKVSLFKGASEELIEDLMNELQPRIFVPGERIFRIDDVGEAMYFIYHGQVEILTRDHTLIATLGEGAFFGEIALISDVQRTATARAATYCDVYELSKASFNRVLLAYPEFKKQIEKTVEERKVKQAA